MDPFAELLRTHMTTRRINEELECHRAPISRREQQLQRTVNERERNGLHRPGDPPNPQRPGRLTGSDQSMGLSSERHATRKRDQQARVHPNNSMKQQLANDPAEALLPQWGPFNDRSELVATGSTNASVTPATPAPAAPATSSVPAVSVHAAHVTPTAPAAAATPQDTGDPRCTVGCELVSVGCSAKEVGASPSLPHAVHQLDASEEGERQLEVGGRTCSGHSSTYQNVQNVPAAGEGRASPTESASRAGGASSNGSAGGGSSLDIYGEHGYADYEARWAAEYAEDGHISEAGDPLGDETPAAPALEQEVLDASVVDPEGLGLRWIGLLELATQGRAVPGSRHDLSGVAASVG